MIKLKKLLQELTEKSDDYIFDWDNHEYYIRYSEHIENDLKRNWSSWDFGQGGIEGDITYVESLIDDVLIGKTDYITISNFDLYEDDLNRGVIFVDKNSGLNYVDRSKSYIGELYDNYWVLIDTVNSAGGLSGHLIDEDIESLSELLVYMDGDGKFKYDGTGDGETFDGSQANIIYSSDDDWHVLELY